jgi:hypothetical protein
MAIDKNSNVYNLLLTTSDGVTIGLRITLTCTVKVTTCKSMISQHVPPLMGLIGLVVTTSCCLGSNPKVDDVALVIFMLVPISTNTKKGGSYLKSVNLGNLNW